MRLGLVYWGGQGFGESRGNSSGEQQYGDQTCLHGGCGNRGWFKLAIGSPFKEQISLIGSIIESLKQPKGFMNSCRARRLSADSVSDGLS